MEFVYLNFVEVALMIKVNCVLVCEHEKPVQKSWCRLSHTLMRNFPYYFNFMCFVRFGLLKVMTMKIVIIQTVMLCSVVDLCGRPVTFKVEE